MGPGNYPIFSQFDFLENKIARLVGELQAARSVMGQLQAENERLNNTLQQQQQEIRQLQKKVEKAAAIPSSFSKSTNFSKIVSDNRNDTATIAELKQQLTVYIDEIDRCIAYLGNLT
ncbi:hypothetical protein [Tellurirhabdus rosea]|uniref:hypothetical protein n=1 Tax=Tellurirhabdus rosea TaxID=2674997 RepID=UPI00224CD845|nr:hypothetical protein [Tellurirhabdus rosea]